MRYFFQNKHRLIIFTISTLILLSVGGFLFWSKLMGRLGSQADATAQYSYIDNFDQTTRANTPIQGEDDNSSRIIKSANSGALSNQHVLMVNPPAATPPVESNVCNDLLSYSLADITTGDYFLDVALKGQITGAEKQVKIIASWQEGLLKTDKFYERVVNSSEIDQNDWTIIHSFFSLPNSYVTGTFELTLIRECGSNIFVGEMDSLAINSAIAHPVGPPADSALSSSTALYHSINLKLADQIDKPLYSLIINGSGKIIKPKGFIRLVFKDTDNKEYQIYENNANLSYNQDFSFASVGDETTTLGKTAPQSLDIYFDEADYKINSIRLITDQARTLAQTVDHNTQKINAYNNAKLGWRAGVTPASQMTYEQKKLLFGGVMPNLMGFEYYVGGGFAIQPSSTTSAISTSSSLPISLDYRNYQGENWMTSVKNQGSAGTCFAFAYIGMMEAQINLHYNQKINTDLSEQQIADCVNGDIYDVPELSNPSNIIGDFMKTINGSTSSFYPYAVCSAGSRNGHLGVALEEEADPYVFRDSGGLYDQCKTENIDPNWKNMMWGNLDNLVDNFRNFGSSYDPRGPWNLLPGASCIDNQITTINNFEDIKLALLRNGPLYTEYGPWNHAMVLMGYLVGTGNEIIGINDDQPIFSEKDQFYLIFKNSWGDIYGYNGYVYLIPNSVDNFLNLYAYNGLLTPPTGQSYDVKCTDKDGDGYYNWGLGPKPTTCPANTPSIEDCDDTSKSLVQLDQNYNCMPLTNVPTVTISTDKISASHGENLTYTVNIQNTLTTEVSDVIVSAPIPNGTSFVSATNGGIIGDNKVTWPSQNLPPGANFTGEYTVSISASNANQNFGAIEPNKVYRLFVRFKTDKESSVNVNFFDVMAKKN